MMNLRKWTWALLLALSTFIVACSNENDEFLTQLESEADLQDNQADLNRGVKSSGPYSNGVFIVNEGWFGHENGSVNYWDGISNAVEHKVYKKENPGKQLGVTTQFAGIQNGHLYLVSKGYGNEKGNVVVANASTLKHEGTIELSGGQCRAFVALNENVGYLSTGGVGTASGSGIYRVDLKNYRIDKAVQNVGNSEVGNMLIASGKLFALRSKQLLIIDVRFNKLMYSIPLSGTAGGMVKDKDGNIWIAVQDELMKINPQTMGIDRIALSGVSVNPSFGWAWNAGSLTYSKSNNSLYFVNEGGWAPRQVACYHINSNQSETLFSIDSDYQIYGAGTYVDPVVQKLYVTAIKGWGQDGKYNRLYVYNLNGTQEKLLNYEHFYFSALCVANE
ncbi:MAG: DUF5074 domain-containing protein [Marinifilum sp.]|jgi:hypothetical protein|nr:DUF5074 domain-containing protein [Marinifilum sp.]